MNICLLTKYFFNFVKKTMQQETKQSRIIFPCHLNDHDTLFGGITLEWMDEIAYITAVRHTRKKMVTISVKNTEFLFPLQVGMIAEIAGKVIYSGNIKLEVHVEIFAEEIYSGSVHKAATSFFTFAAIDDNHKAVRM
jgi:acyl-CoA hydrolase